LVVAVVVAEKNCFDHLEARTIGEEAPKGTTLARSRGLVNSDLEETDLGVKVISWTDIQGEYWTKLPKTLGGETIESAKKYIYLEPEVARILCTIWHAAHVKGPV
jgi:hypothetical protein